MPKYTTNHDTRISYRNDREKRVAARQVMAVRNADRTLHMLDTCRLNGVKDLLAEGFKGQIIVAERDPTTHQRQTALARTLSTPDVAIQTVFGDISSIPLTAHEDQHGIDYWFDLEGKSIPDRVALGNGVIQFPFRSGSSGVTTDSRVQDIQAITGKRVCQTTGYGRMIVVQVGSRQELDPEYEVKRIAFTPGQAKVFWRGYGDKDATVWESYTVHAKWKSPDGTTHAKVEFPNGDIVEVPCSGLKRDPDPSWEVEQVEFVDGGRVKVHWLGFDDTAATEWPSCIVHRTWTESPGQRHVKVELPNGDTLQVPFSGTPVLHH